VDIQKDKSIVSPARKPSFSSSDRITISNQKDVHIILPPSASHATSSGILSNLRRCIIDMSEPTTAPKGGPFATLTLKNIKDSLIVCGQVSGPAHVTGVERSVIVTSCRQLRMHDCKAVDVYLFCTSRPIIEDCEEIRFAPFPDHYVSSSRRPAVKIFFTFC
jgi:tubulin-specific chaperone C